VRAEASGPPAARWRARLLLIAAAALPLLPASSGAAAAVDGPARAEGRSAAPAPASPLSGTIDVKDYGARADGKTDDAPAVQAAIDAAIAMGGVVFFPPGAYAIREPLKIASGSGKIALRGAGRASQLLNLVTGDPADPLIAITAQSNYFEISDLWLRGNGVSGAGGNGHALAFVNPKPVSSGTYWPQQVIVDRVIVEQHLGNGKDESGRAIPACAVFGFNGTAHTITGSMFYENATGVRWKAMHKAYLIDTTIDRARTTALYLETSQQIGVTNSILNGSGSGGATDGLVYLAGNDAVSFTGSRLKNGNPYGINATGPTVFNHAISFFGCDFNQLEPETGHVAVAIGTSTSPFLVEGSRFLFVNTIHDAVGVLVTQAGRGYAGGGLVVRGNFFRIGEGGTLEAAVRVNAAKDTVYSCLIESNLIGWQERSGVPTRITYGVDLQRNASGCAVRSNTFVTGVNVTMDTAVALRAPSVRGTLIESNSYIGAISHQVTAVPGADYRRADPAPGK
jgi:hypothetical protein